MNERSPDPAGLPEGLRRTLDELVRRTSTLAASTLDRETLAELVEEFSVLAEDLGRFLEQGPDHRDDPAD